MAVGLLISASEASTMESTCGVKKDLLTRNLTTRVRLRVELRLYSQPNNGYCKGIRVTREIGDRSQIADALNVLAVLYSRDDPKDDSGPHPSC